MSHANDIVHVTMQGGRDDNLDLEDQLLKVSSTIAAESLLNPAEITSQSGKAVQWCTGG
jgi:hypothetical protein